MALPREYNPSALIVTMSEDGEIKEVGRLQPIYYPDDREYGISDFFVHPDFRRRGIGTALLGLAKIDAKELGATSIGGLLVSREAIETARKAFGSDTVDVDKEGTYNPPVPGREDVYNASAELRVHDLEIW